MKEKPKVLQHMKSKIKSEMTLRKWADKHDIKYKTLIQFLCGVFIPSEFLIKKIERTNYFSPTTIKQLKAYKEKRRLIRAKELEQDKYMLMDLKELYNLRKKISYYINKRVALEQELKRKFENADL